MDGLGGDMGMAGPGAMGMGGLGGNMGMVGPGGMGIGGLGEMGMGSAQMNGVDGTGGNSNMGMGGNWPYDPATQMQLGGLTPDFTGRMNGKAF